MGNQNGQIVQNQTFEYQVEAWALLLAAFVPSHALLVRADLGQKGRERSILPNEVSAAVFKCRSLLECHFTLQWMDFSIWISFKPLPECTSVRSTFYYPCTCKHDRKGLSQFQAASCSLSCPWAFGVLSHAQSLLAKGSPAIIQGYKRSLCIA